MNKLKKTTLSISFLLLSLIIGVFNHLEKKPQTNSNSLLLAGDKGKKIDRPVPNCQRCVKGGGA